jgi:hypothetical protein
MVTRRTPRPMSTRDPLVDQLRRHWRLEPNVSRTGCRISTALGQCIH